MATSRSSVRPCFVAELVGAAGTGKSALSQRLARRPGVLRASVWNLPRGWWLLNALRSVPTLVGLCVRAWAVPWDDVGYIIRLRTLNHMLARWRARQVRFVILDEGPVFALAWLRLFGEKRLRGDAMKRWWRGAVRQWAATVDLVVLLDAPDPVLARRIRTRERPHRVKQSTDAEIGAFCAAYRQAFGEVIAALTAENGVRVVALESDGEAEDRTADRVLQLLEGDVHVE